MTHSRIQTLLAVGLLAAAPLAANNLLVTSAAAMGAGAGEATCTGDGLPGPCGLEIELVDQNNTFVRSDHAEAEPAVKITFLIDPNVAIDPGDSLIFFKAFREATPGAEHLVGRVKRTGNGNTFKFVLYQKQNQGFRRLVAAFPLRGVSAVRDRKIEIEWVKATPGNPDGVIRVYRDGALRSEKTDVFNSDMDIDRVQVGVFGVGSTTGTQPTGSIHFDEFALVQLP